MRKNANAAQATLAPRSPSAPATREPEPQSWWLRLSPLWIVLAVVAVYIKVLSFDFTGLDDLEILKERYFIIGHLSNIKLAFTTDAFLGTTGTFYRPLQTLSFMVDAFLGGPVKTAIPKV